MLEDKYKHLERAWSTRAAGIGENQFTFALEQFTEEGLSMRDEPFEQTGEGDVAVVENAGDELLVAFGGRR